MGRGTIRRPEEGAGHASKLRRRTEDRHVAGGQALALTFTIDSTTDGSDTSAGDGNCVATTGGCTLRAAMQDANALPDADTIAFDIAGSGVHAIHVVGGHP